MQQRRHDLPDPAGRQVVTADGDEIGRVERVIELPAEEDDALLVVDATAFEPPLPDDQLIIPQQAVHLVTEHDVVLGTSTAWLLHDRQSRKAE